MSGLDLPPGPFGCILADPPWNHRPYSAKGLKRSPSRHYAVMGVKQIAAMPVPDIAAKDCHLFLWTTGPHLQEAFTVLNAWGFRYSSMGFVWAKLWPRERDALMFTAESFAVGLGHTTRKNVEYCLLGRRGSPRRHAKDIRELIISARREHSRKPEECRERIERYAGDVPKLELFARSERPGWTSWGNEVGKFNESA